MQTRRTWQACLAGVALSLAITSPAQAIDFDACDEGNVLPLAFRILDLSKAQLRYIHWVKVWRYAVNAGPVGKKLPKPKGLKALADDLRASHREIDDCAQHLVQEHERASAAVKANTQKTIKSLQASRTAIAKLESALKVSEFKLDQRVKKKRGK